MGTLIVKIEGDKVNKEDLIYELKDMQEQMMEGYQCGSLSIKHLGKNNQWYEKRGYWEIEYKEDGK